jgi:hypothetical protein
VFQAKKAKQADIDRKRAEVRKRLEETAKAKKAKKGFMTPERKKKLRVSRELAACCCSHCEVSECYRHLLGQER